ncbi:hypothetical protein EOD41_02890 [Mucilaginibacter limnophilus]|uniref:MoxR-vWA-beta-propeller ternary system domain-containing protein n=1 Tax=Mucilaginibacter limnophilus TaxID=1932778 RepID=A0A437MYZ3_9SPHI|nr:hypothetical protein [Mucilaginibacter limnophilus]RVU02901.1 hypothetical protein EOD41_02890 [Mucilaginibacter limnophilus]
MKLSKFVQGLFTEGVVNVPRQLLEFHADDLRETAILLQQYQLAERLELAFNAPDFDESAGLWAAQYFYRAIQFVLLRELEEAAIQAYLKAYEEPVTCEAIYSVDLIFRHLAPLFKLSSGLAPSDPLVQMLKETAAAWPYSSVGLDITPSVSTAVIINHPSLKYAYIDRIIQHRDQKRITNNMEKQALEEVLGLYSDLLWPKLQLPNLH